MRCRKILIVPTILALILAAGCREAPRATAPYAWLLEGLPKCSYRKGSIASATAGSMGVVAL